MTSWLAWSAFAGAGAMLALVAWNRFGWPRVSAGRAGRAGAVSILIPARNEEAVLRAALEGALAQGEAALEVLVYDDHSTDGTAAIAREFETRSPKIRRVEPEDLPAGWCGKPFACARLAGAARGDWLLFVDADTRLAPDAAARMAAEAERRGVTFLSCWPGLDCGGFWERVFMPMLNFVVLTLFPAPLSFRRRWPSLGLAHGACILARRRAYEATGGHALVRGEIFEDTALARAWRRAGEAGICLDGQDLVRVRMYDSLAGLWGGFRKNIYPAFRHEASFWLFLALHGACFLLPFVAAPGLAIAGIACWPMWGAAACGVAARWVQAGQFGFPRWSAWLLPAAEAGMLALAVASWFACRTGRGVTWKGRVYRGGRAA